MRIFYTTVKPGNPMWATCVTLHNNKPVFNLEQQLPWKHVRRLLEGSFKFSWWDVTRSVYSSLYMRILWWHFLLLFLFWLRVTLYLPRARAAFMRSPSCRERPMRNYWRLLVETKMAAPRDVSVAAVASVISEHSSLIEKQMMAQKAFLSNYHKDKKRNYKATTKR